ncbi:uncharacterized protein LOC118220385 [Anguilla anguilla]|uniref:uncharacterized protein LOC118220385 n=1 Tax=Anguilla anguilla TaxID=7936 RepID=UPI0015A88F45|nr:uncharacterized protein LOC118220385 [Anguilla anguilla]
MPTDLSAYQSLLNSFSSAVATAKLISPEIIPFIAHLINSSLTSGTFPSSFKRAHITPILKKPTLDPCLTQNYRPDNRLSLSENIAATTRSCRFILYNIRRIRPLLTNYSTQLLVQAMILSRLDYCNSLLAGLPASATRPLQLIQNAAARLVYNLPRDSHVTPLLISLHWLPVQARIRFKTLVLAFQAVKGSAPGYLQKMIRPYKPARSLRSATTGRLIPPPTRAATRSRLFAVLAPRWWNDLPVEVRTAECLSTFKRKLKTHLFSTPVSFSGYGTAAAEEWG